MPKTTSRRLTLVEAARLLYRTDAPSDQQIGRVYERMKSGAIRVADRRGAPHDWTTTEQSLAEYVAAEMTRRQKLSIEHAYQRPPQNSFKAGDRSQQDRDARSIRDVYQNIWRDAFLAILLRRRMAHRSATFHRGVLFSQIALLLLLVGILLGAARFATQETASERVAIENWIDAQTDTYQIIRWHATQPSPDGAGYVVEVEYRYTRESRRPVDTRRTFLVVGEEITERVDE